MSDEQEFEVLEENLVQGSWVNEMIMRIVSEIDYDYYKEMVWSQDESCIIESITAIIEDYIPLDH